MKKKILLIAAVILVSLGLLSISKIVQDKYLNRDSVSIEQKANDKTLKEVTIKEDTNKEVMKPKVTEETAKTNVESKTVTEQKKVVESKAEVKSTVTKAPITTENVPKEPVATTPEPIKEPNFIVKDEISGKIILAINISVENKTVGEITLSELDKKGINYKATGRGEAVYFTMINNLKARDYGALSGWCYYVNGAKPSISCGAYKLKSSDVVEWKYLKDGVNN